MSTIFSSIDELKEIEPSQTSDREGCSSSSLECKNQLDHFVTTMFRQVPALLDDNDVNDDVVHGHHHILLLVLHTKVGPLG